MYNAPGCRPGPGCVSVMDEAKTNVIKEDYKHHVTDK